MNPALQVYLSRVTMEDRGDLDLILLIYFLAMGSILFLRWRFGHMVSAYWLSGTVPGGTGTLLGLYQYDRTTYQLMNAGWSQPMDIHEALDRGLLTIHFGLFLSVLLYLLILYFYARDFMLGVIRR